MDCVKKPWSKICGFLFIAFRSENGYTVNIRNGCSILSAGKEACRPEGRKKANMINRVNGNDYYDYTKLSMPTSAETASNGEKFSLDYQRADDKKEEDEGKEKISKEEMGKQLSGNGAQTVLHGGVRLELSGNGQGKDPAGQEGMLSDLLQTVRSWIATLIQSFKGIINRIWNDPVPEQEVVQTEDVPLEETDRLSEEYRDINSSEAISAGDPLPDRAAREKEIQKYLRTGNLEQVISMLTEDGHRTIAKNSTLLTYYDRTGRLTSLSASDQERILHGDRNSRKL